VIVTRIELLNISTGWENTLWRTKSQPLAMRMAENALTTTSFVWIVSTDKKVGEKLNSFLKFEQNLNFQG
jgi:hypothetical protein